MSAQLNGTAGRYDHIQLGRDFRDYVKPRLKALPGWSDYRTAQGWGGRTQSLTRAEIIAACEALGFDLLAANADFVGQLASGIVAAMPMRPRGEVDAAIDAAFVHQMNEATVEGELDAQRPGPNVFRPDGKLALPVNMATEGDKFMGDPERPSMSHTDAAPGASEAEKFEGQDVETVIADMSAPASVHMTPHLARCCRV